MRRTRIGGDFCERFAALDGRRVVFDAPRRVDRIVALFDQQPRIFFAAATFDVHEREPAAQFFPEHFDLHGAARDLLRGARAFE